MQRKRLETKADVTRECTLWTLRTHSSRHVFSVAERRRRRKTSIVRDGMAARGSEITIKKKRQSKIEKNFSSTAESVLGISEARAIAYNLWNDSLSLLFLIRSGPLALCAFDEVEGQPVFYLMSCMRKEFLNLGVC